MGRRKRETLGRRERRNLPREAGPGSRGDRGDLLWAAGLTLLAWVHRLILLRSNRDARWPYTFFYEGDSETFYMYARALLEGRLYDNGVPFHPPGFAWVLSAVHSLVGAGAGAERVPHLAVKSVVALIGSFAVGLLYLLVKPYLGRTVALVAALLCVYHFGLSVLSIAPVTESTYLVLLLLALLVWTRRLEHPLAAPGAQPGGWKAALGLGLILGALALTRAEGALIAVILVGTGLAGWLRKRGSLRLWVLVILGWVLAVAPWTVRNAVRLGEMNERLAGRLAEPIPTFVPLTIYGPLNLALANNPQADGTFSRDFLASRAQSGVLDFTDPQHLEFILHGDRIAWGWIRQNPGDFLQLVGRKWTLFLSAWKLGWTQWNWPGGLDGLRRPVDVFLPDSSIALALGPPLALLGLLYGLAIPGGPRRWAVLVLLLTAAGLLVTGLFFGYARLGLLVLPFWLTWTATGLVWLAERLLHPREGWSRAIHESIPSRRLLQGLAAAALVLLALELWGITLHRNFKATGTNVPGRNYLDRDQPMRLEVIEP
jgi:hypothetical protein